MSHALCFIAGRFHLTFTSGKHLFMLERASATTAPAHTCKISPLGRRILLEIWNGACGWWLQQHGGQQQYGQLFGVCFVWSVWLLPCLRTRSDVARKWPDGHFVIWSRRRSAKLAACDHAFDIPIQIPIFPTKSFP